VSKPQTPLYQFRRARTISQEDLARLAEISQQTLSKYERGVLLPPADRQARLAAILGVPVTSLFPSEAVAS
jgi:transcriptional regulator with XRE-family HTH domain